MRKVWMVGGIAVGACLSFIALLVVGTYSAAAGLASGGGGQSVALAKGAVPAIYQPIVQKWGNLCPAINPALLAAQLYQESGWKPDVTSHADARGIAQFIPDTWAAHGVDGNGDGKRDIWDPQDAIPSAASYDCELAKYVRNVPGDNTNNMLAAYNAGAYRVIKAGGVPPISETQGYVKTIRTLEKASPAPPPASSPPSRPPGPSTTRSRSSGRRISGVGRGPPSKGAVRLFGAYPGRLREHRDRAAARRQRPVQRRPAPLPRRAPPR